MYNVISDYNCRSCGSENLKKVLSLRDMPPGDKYSYSIEQVATHLLPSSIFFCTECMHIQMESTADPAYIYGSYLSRPAATNKVLYNEYERYAEWLVDLIISNGLSGTVLESGSNDGLFLRLLTQKGIRAIGIEPASNLLENDPETKKRTINSFFNNESVREAKERLGTVSLILSNHSFSNVLNIQEWVETAASALSDNGLLVLQTFYQPAVLKDLLIENYNHEHLSYSTVTSLNNLFFRYNLKLLDAFEVSAKGGSIRLVFKKTDGQIQPSKRASSLLQKEKDEFFPNIESMFRNTQEYISMSSERLVKLLAGTDRVCAYGTSINATVLAYQFGIHERIQVFFDDDPMRQSTFSPGTGKEVRPGRSTEMNIYEYCIILAPLYADKIVENNAGYSIGGGKFIVVRPEVRIV
jgi:hypothetical protein